MLECTTQSQKVVLSEEERRYFDQTPLEDILKFTQNVRRSREETKALSKRNAMGLNYYFNMQGKGHTYNNPFASTPYRIGCRLLAEFISKHISDKNARLLDVGAGSGYLAVEVNKLGFMNLDCVEPSRQMIAMQTEGLYRNVYMEIIKKSVPNTVTPGSYDAIVINGAVYPGCIEVEDFHSLFLLVKPGGFVIFNLSDYWYSHEDFGYRLDSMVQGNLQNGIFERLVKQRKAYIYPVEDATLYLLEKSY